LKWRFARSQTRQAARQTLIDAFSGKQPLL
jgi:hypothetical protein